MVAGRPTGRGAVGGVFRMSAPAPGSAAHDVSCCDARDVCSYRMGQVRGAGSFSFDTETLCSFGRR